MKINVLQTIKNLDGTDASDSEGPLTLRKAFTLALVQPLQGENPDGEEKFRRYQLATRIQTNDEIDLLPEQAVLLKKVVGMGYPAIVVGQVYELLNS